jgi:hypothetical protein
MLSIFPIPNGREPWNWTVEGGIEDEACSKVSRKNRKLETAA